MALRRIFFIVPVILTGIFLFPPVSLSANNLAVVINEVAWMGTTVSANDEWLELYNNTSADIDLTSWTLTAQDGTPNIVLTSTTTILIIKAHDYFLLERTSDDTVIGIAADQIYVGALGNSGEALELRDADNNLIDSINAATGWPAGHNDEKKTMERINPLTASQNSNWASSNLTDGTPKALNSVYIASNNTPVASAGNDQEAIINETVAFDGSGSADSDGTIVDYQWDFGDGGSANGVLANHAYNTTGLFSVILMVTDDDGATTTDNLTVEVAAASSTPAVINPRDLVINEFVSDPLTGAKEWLELYNNTTSTLNLNGLTLEDGIGVIANLAGTVSAHSFYVQELSVNKLNNDGDKIILKSGAVIIDQVAYGTWSDGNLSDNAPVADDSNSIARKIDGQDSDVDSSDFSLTITPTKNSANSITANPSSNPPTPPANSSTGGGASQPVIIVFNVSDIVINEFISDPSDGEVEWVELYNNTANIINLDGWKIEEGSGKSTGLTGAIYSQQMAVVVSPKGSLNNSGDLIILKDPAGNIIDRVAYGNWPDGNVFDNALVASDPDAVARFIDGQNSGINYNDFRITDQPTKGLPNIIGDLATTTVEIKNELPKEKIITKFPPLIITEVFPNPAGADTEAEFIEIYNPNNEEVELAGWLLDDTNGGSRPYKITDLTIASHEHLAFFRKTTGLALNNDTDRARLINPLQEVVSEVEYKNIKEDLAYALTSDNKWQVTSAPTPGDINEIESAEAASAGSGSGQIVRITGTVAVEPGVLGSQIFYLSNEDIQVYSYKKDFPALAVGDVVVVTGEISEGTVEKRIKIKSQSDIKIIGKKTELLPTEISISEIDETIEGKLVKIAGQVIEVRGNYVFIDDGTDEAMVYIKSSTNIDKAIFNEGDKVEVLGIISQTKSGYRLLPRYNTDILPVGSVKGVEEQASQPSDNSMAKYFIAVIIFLAAVIGYLVYQQVKLKSLIK